MPANDSPRRITLHKAPFDFYHSRSSVTCYSQTGEFLVPARVADAAVSQGYATEGWARDSRTRTSKSGPARKRATSPAKRAMPKADAATTTTDNGTDAGLAGEGLSADDRAGVRGAVDQAAE
jgi:hypothetical protein